MRPSGVKGVNTAGMIPLNCGDNTRLQSNELAHDWRNYSLLLIGCVGNRSQIKKGQHPFAGDNHDFDLGVRIP